MKSSVATSEVAQPYAQALMSIAQSKNLTDEFGNDTRSLLELLKNPETQNLRDFLANPFVLGERKKNLLNQILGSDTNTYFRNFILLLVDRRRIILLEDICQEYLNLLRQLKQTVLAEVTSVTDLTETQLDAVRSKVITMTGAREVEIETKVDADLIGGLIIKVGSQVVDASLRGQLRRLSLRLNNA
jgi:F-type H+-transporting ATPase subunit delta